MGKLKSITKTKINAAHSIPEGAKILDKRTTIEVEEIENGFLIKKICDIKYEKDGEIGWCDSCKKYFSKEDPLQVKVEETSLAQFFD